MVSLYYLLKKQYPIVVPLILSYFGGFGVESRERGTWSCSLPMKERNIK